MSTDYIAYAQTHIGDDTIALGPFVKDKNGGFKLVPVLETCSWFREAADWMSERPHDNGIPKKIAPELHEIFDFDNDDANIFGNAESYYSQCMKVYRFVDIVDMVKKDRPYKYRGYITKEKYAQYDSGEDDEIEYWYTIDEYNDMDEDEKKEFVYFEWNQDFDAYGGVSRLVRNMQALLDAWDNAYGSEWDYKERIEAIQNAEIILYVSY